MSPPRVQRVCTGCREVFEPVQERDRLCPRCRSVNVTAEAARDAREWTLYIAGVDEGLRAPQGTPEPRGGGAFARGMRTGMRRRPDPALYGPAGPLPAAADGA